MDDPVVGDSDSYMKTRFLERIAHDIRGPSGVALGALEELESALGPELANRHAKLISMTRKSTRKILRLAQKLACAAEMSLGPLLDLAPVRLGPLAESAARGAESIDGRRGVAIELAPSITSPSGRQDLVSADANWIEMLLIELVGNALKHAHSKVVVNLAQDADSVSISVTDDGRGPPPVTGPLFGPNQDLRGLGLSLAMGDRIARAHHGSLAIVRTPSKGTAVTLSLPLLGRTQIVGGDVESPSVPPENLGGARRDQATLNPRGRRPMGSTRR